MAASNAPFTCGWNGYKSHDTCLFFGLQYLEAAGPGWRLKVERRLFQKVNSMVLDAAGRDTGERLTGVNVHEYYRWFWELTCE